MFVINDVGLGFDVNGYNQLRQLLQPVLAWSEQIPLPVTIEEIEADIMNIEMSTKFHTVVFEIANNLIEQLNE